MTEFDFVKTIYSWGFPIECYVQYNTITKDQYKEITGKDYVDASTSTSDAGASESTSTDTVKPS
ncbi:XkdX family protein [Limosilactobacillus mucosae]|nr:XkdX family protein [Limosilactobacillus mucosae]